MSRHEYATYICRWTQLITTDIFCWHLVETQWYSNMTQFSYRAWIWLSWEERNEYHVFREYQPPSDLQTSFSSCFIYFICLYWCPTRFPCHLMFVSYNCNMTGATNGAGTAYPAGAPMFIRRYLVGFVLFCWRLFVFLFFFYFYSLYCLSFHLWFLITPFLFSSISFLWFLFSY